MNGENVVLVAIVGAWTLVKLTTLTLRHRQQARRDRAREESTTP